MDDRHHDERVLAEARALGPDSYPTRAFYGHYLEWVFQRVATTAAGLLTTVVHEARAVSLADATGTADGPDGAAQSVLLDDGTLIEGLDAVVLAQGHLPARRHRPPARTRPASRGRTACATSRPPTPPTWTCHPYEPGETVLLRGLGLNFFDHMALLTLGRGGRFERRGEGPGAGLVYRPRGASRGCTRGPGGACPYHARGENAKGAHGRHEPAVLTPDVIGGLRERRRRRRPRLPRASCGRWSRRRSRPSTTRPCSPARAAPSTPGGFARPLSGGRAGQHPGGAAILDAVRHPGGGPLGLGPHRTAARGAGVRLAGRVHPPGCSATCARICGAAGRQRRRPAQGRARRPAGPAQRAPPDRRPRRPVRPLAPRGPGRAGTRRSTPSSPSARPPPHRGDDRADRGRRAGGARPRHRAVADRVDAGVHVESPDVPGSA